MAHRIALDPNNAQATYLARAAGVARFAYHWALAQWTQQYEACKLDASLPKPSQAALRRQLNAIKREQFPWMLEVTKNAPQMAIIQLGDAFKNFFAGRTKYPQFRKKGRHERFSLTNDQFVLDGCRIRIPHLGWVRMREALRFSGNILLSATVSRSADRWFVSIAIETPDDAHLPQAKNQGVVGVDCGMVKNRCLARSIADMGFFEFRRQLHYKAAMRGGQVVAADRWFASSKTCSACGHKLESLPLSVRQWRCPKCGAHHDRDVNAAINLKQVAESSAGDCQRIQSMAVCSVTACGEEGAGLGRKTQVKPASVKQEVSSRFSQK